MFDSITNAAEGLFLLFCSIRLIQRTEGQFAWTFAFLWAAQGLSTLAWALWSNDPVLQQMNEWEPMYIEIAAFLWLAFYARFLRKKIAGT